MSTSPGRGEDRQADREDLKSGKSTDGQQQNLRAGGPTPSVSEAAKGLLKHINPTSVVQIFALIFLVLYSIMINGYDRFYSKVGVRPEDVGLDKYAILSRTLGIAPYLLFALSSVIYLILFSRIARRWARSGRSRWIRLVLPISVLYSTLVVLSVAYLSTVYLLLGISLAQMRVEEGARVTPVDGIAFTVFELHAEPASVEWVGLEGREPPALSQDRPTSYIGQSGLTTVLYVVDLGVVRVPSASISVTLPCLSGSWENDKKMRSRCDGKLNWNAK